MKEEKLLAIFNHVQKKKNKSEIKQINPKFLLRDDLGFDSLDLAEITVRIEDEFNVDIFEDGFVQTVSEILEKIE
jgi:acyl carrier protein